MRSKAQNPPSNESMIQFVDTLLAQVRIQVRDDFTNASQHIRAYQILLQYAADYFYSAGETQRAAKFTAELDEMKNQAFSDLLGVFDRRLAPLKLQEFLQSTTSDGQVEWQTGQVRFEKSQQTIDNKTGLALELLNPEALSPEELARFLQAILPSIKAAKVNFVVITATSTTLAQILKDQFGFKSAGDLARNSDPLFLSLSD